MATFTNLENAHVFSKAVITPSMGASAAGNTSAHTIQSKDTWAEAVPFLEKSDLSGVSADKEFKIEGYGTVKFHYKKNVYCLINSNNNNIPSNGYVGKIIDSEGNTISQFISPTDVVNDAGQMATVYQPSLYNSKGESMPLSDYIINSSNGLIYDLKSTGNQGIFATSAVDGRTEYKLSFFTYEGAKLDTTITNIKSSINQTKDDLSSHTSDTDIHITTSERSSWDTAVATAATAVQTVKRADDSSTLISVNQSGTTVSVGLSNTVATKTDVSTAKQEAINAAKVTLISNTGSGITLNPNGTASNRFEISVDNTIATKNDITNLENKIVDKTVRIIPGTNNITADLVETENEVDSYTISVDGYTIEEVNSLLKNKADEKLLENTISKVSDLTKNLQDVESNLLKHASNGDEDVLHVTQAEKDIWNAGGNALQEIIEGDHIEVDGNTVGVNTTSLVADTIFTTKVNELIGEETTRATQREDEIENLIKNKVEALPSVYTGNDELYINCYGFEYTDPSENIILDKIEIKFAKNLDTLTEFRAPNAPVISSEEVENDICKIVVAKVKTPPSGGSEPSASDEIEIATSSYNTNISKEINLSQFKFGENIILEKGWNYRFYFYDKNDNLFAAPVIANTIPSGDATLAKSSVANRYLSERYDYWGAYNFISNNVVLNGLGIKLINSVQEHINDKNIHITEYDKNTWNSKLSSISASSNNNYVGATVNNGNNVVISPNVVTDISTTATGKLIDANTIKSYIDEHTSNGDIHITIDDKNNWNTSNIEYKALNKDITSYKDGVLTYGNGTTENINLEKTVSAQYAFAKYSSSTAATINEFNLRTIKNDYTANDGANYENDCVVSDDEAVNTLANLINGRGMFLRSRLTTFNDELPCLMLGDIMFKDSKSLSNFRSPLPSLTCASGMFRGCTSLTTFRTKLPNLSRAKSMFNDDSELTIVDTCLPNLTYGNNMFSNCPKLTIVNLSSTSLNNLYDGTFMFHCNTIRDFNKFRGNLSSLETAEYMFTGCRLDLESVTRIADTIRDWSGDNSSPCEHRIGIGVNSKSSWTNWNAFEEQKTRITNKGWIIAQWQENGVDPEPVESAALTYYYAKPASGYASPEYIDENGNKVTLILTHYTDCKDEYEIVSSREEAEIRFNLTKIEKTEE